MESESSEDRITQIHASLSVLGTPQSSLDELPRFFKGPVEEVLVFLSEHMKGRQAVSEARNAILMYHQVTDSKYGGSRHTACDKGEKRRKSLKSSKETVERLQKQIEQLQSTIGDSQAQLGQLQKTLTDKRRLSLLFSVLEKKENIRRERFVELACQAEAARLNAPNTTPQAASATLHSGTNSNCTTPWTLTSAVYAEHTRDTITAIQAHLIQLSELRAAQQSQRLPTDSEKIESRTVTAIAKHLKLPDDNRQVQSRFAAIRKAAREAAINRLQFSPVNGSDGTDATDADVEAASIRTAEKERALQHSFDDLTALNLSCGQHLHALSAYHDATIPTLNESLEEELHAVHGYLDTLRLLVDAQTPLENERTILSAKLSGLIPRRAAGEVQKDVINAHELRDFVQSVDFHGMEAKPATSATSAVIRSYSRTEADVNKRAMELLSRKNSKKEAVGDVLVKDIERLKKEVDMLVNGAL